MVIFHSYVNLPEGTRSEYWKVPKFSRNPYNAYYHAYTKFTKTLEHKACKDVSSTLQFYKYMA